MGRRSGALAAYTTYDLPDAATLKSWPLQLIAVDMASAPC